MSEQALPEIEGAEAEGPRRRGPAMFAQAELDDWQKYSTSLLSNSAT